jgi:DNA topoisomerase VI subunit B
METNVDEMLESSPSELANEDLLELENNTNDDSHEPFLSEPIKQLSTKQITKFFKYIDSSIRIIE